MVMLVMLMMLVMLVMLVIISRLLLVLHLPLCSEPSKGMMVRMWVQWVRQGQLARLALWMVLLQALV
jgi:hypothetical protein